MIHLAVQALRQGEIVGLPTDTVYGLAVVPTDAAAVERLYQLKGRPRYKPLALLVASRQDAESLVELDEVGRGLADRHWPGALTLVARTVRPLPEWVGDPVRATVGVRMPDHGFAVELLEWSGPLAVTSANLSGEPPATDHLQAERTFGSAVAVYLPGVCPGGSSSTVVDVTVSPPRVLRPGPIDLAD